MLENQQAEKMILLKDQFSKTLETLKPSNLLKTTIHEVTTPPQVKDGIVNTGIGLAAGYLSQKILVGSSSNPVKMVLGSILKFAVTNLVTKHPGTILSVGKGVMNMFARKNHAPYAR